MNTNDEYELSFAPPIEVPREALSPDALDNLIESFILREGTDYGAREIELSTKKDQVLKQLERGDIKIAFDPNSESVTLLTARDWKKRSQSCHKP